MQRQSSIGSRIAWSVIAAMVLGMTCFVSLRVLPEFEGVFKQMRMPLPTFTRLMLAAGPAVLITMGMTSAALMVLGEFNPPVRRIREPFAFLVSVLAITAVAAMFMPRFKCGEIINPKAPAPVVAPAK
jgi:hypothetical protein